MAILPPSRPGLKWHLPDLHPSTCQSPEAATLCNVNFSLWTNEFVAAFLRYNYKRFVFFYFASFNAVCEQK